MIYILLLVVVAGATLLYNKKQVERTSPPFASPKKWDQILIEKVNFYRNLNDKDRLRFKNDLANFLSAVRITGVKTNVSVEDRILVASSAVIPLFGFPAWTYRHLDEVLLYPDSFDRNFNIGSKSEIITGMVGNGAMEGKVILSKPSLHLGFDISNDKKNVGIHEFVHLFDKESGAIDGIPPGYEDKSFTLPWLDFINHKSAEIINQRSDINEYATTNKQEFFAVASEYFLNVHICFRKNIRNYMISCPKFSIKASQIQYN
ncbi:zinc-dependent peptidase [Reichenbachiella sp.]|uniref:M90 family metallopeptidase n=1 Tax=Reichenbachiella sp. TaxID=2184521 RepID=UPI003BB1F24E